MTYIYNSEELKTRKLWLVASWICLGITFFTIELFFLLLNKELLSLSIFERSLFHSAFPLLFLLTPFYFLYRCAYEKPGTRFLSFCTIFCTGRLVLNLLFISSTLNSFELTVFALLLPLNLWWIFLSWKLRRINHNIQTFNSLRFNPPASDALLTEQSL